AGTYGGRGGQRDGAARGNRVGRMGDLGPHRCGRARCALSRNQHRSRACRRAGRGQGRMDSVVLIPAAGRGSRLGSSLPKALVPVNGTPMLEHLLRLYGAVADRFIVIGAPGFEQLAAPQIRGPSRKVEFAVQAEPTGMLDAIL